MNIVEVRKVEDKYKDCTDCTLCDNRKNTPHFGMGHPEGKILIVLPEPYVGMDYELRDKILYDTAPIQANHRLYKPFNQLMTKVGISKLDLYTIPAIMCPVEKDARPEKEQVIACRPRLRETVRAFNPKVLVLCGPIAYFSWYQEMPEDDKYGQLSRIEATETDHSKTIYYTRNIDNFLTLQRSQQHPEEEIAQLKEQILSDWMQVKELAEQ